MGKQKLKINDAKLEAKKFKGKCISKRYFNIKSKLKFKCKNNHIFYASLDDVKNGHWCKKCAHENLRLGIGRAKKIAGNRGFLCLSKRYKNAASKLKFKCKHGHIFKTTITLIQRGHNCKKCAIIGISRNINDVIKIAESHGGKCYSTKYKNNYSYLKFECKNGHKFKSTFHAINKGIWCKKCLSLTIEDARREVLKFDGKCLSKRYFNIKSKLKFKCKNGHTFLMSLHSVKNNHWCHKCKNKSEELVRKIFECLFGKEFLTIRPKWLMGVKNFPLQLDGYCSDLNIAFEHQGHHHYGITIFSKTEEKFNRIKQNDKIKKEICEQKGIVLIEVPDISVHFKSVNEIKEYIINKLNSLNIVPPFKDKKLNLIYYRYK